MREVQVTVFKPTGKFYTEETVQLPDNVGINDIGEYVKSYFRSRFSGMILVITGEFTGMFPVIILNHY